MAAEPNERLSWLDQIIRFCLERKLIVFLLVIAIITWGALVAPFDWDLEGLPRDPVPVDAIPDIGENQQIVFTDWMGRSPQDVEDQVTYPLTVALLGIPGVKTVRSYSFFGFSSIYVLFDEDVEFYWSRSRVLEKLASLPPGTLPNDVRPTLGPDATALGQVFWYTLEGRDLDGRPTGGWAPDELRSIQDWYVRTGLLAARGVSEVGSIGGFVREYQIDVDPDAMRAYGVTLDQIFSATRMSNLDVGARTVEINRVEYVIRGLGFIESVEDIEETVVTVNENVPIRIQDVAQVTRGPALRRGVLDKNGVEAVGGVVVVRFGANPLAAIQNVKEKIGEIAPGLPARVLMDPNTTDTQELATFAAGHRLEPEPNDLNEHEAWVGALRATSPSEWPSGVTLTQVTIVPFYDRTGLIQETLGTLNEALLLEILITALVVIVMVLHLRSSLLISVLLPLAVLMCFIAMRVFNVSANIVALSGIAIAIGTMVDMGVIVSENILRHLEEADPGEPRRSVIERATREVGSAVLTAVATTVISFLPVFTMTGAEGKLFRPLAFTKTFALVASIVVALTIIPPAAHLLFTRRVRSGILKQLAGFGLAAGAVFLAVTATIWGGVLLLLVALNLLVRDRLPLRLGKLIPWGITGLSLAILLVLLTREWLPLGPERGQLLNIAFVGGLLGGLLALFLFFQRSYTRVLGFCLRHKLLFLSLPSMLLIAGACAWLGFHRVFAFVPRVATVVGIDPGTIRESAVWRGGHSAFPGLGKEFMPALDEGSFLYMPSTMAHASLGEALEVMQLQDRALAAIPEIESAVGKLGRVDSPLDPAPISMIETVIRYHSEYVTAADGKRVRFRFDEEEDEFVRDDSGLLIPDDDGRPFRQWRPHIRSADDIWDEILRAAAVPGTSSAPRLQPIAARLVMLQSGMRAPMGVKIKGPDLDTIARVAVDIEQILQEVPGVEPASVLADRLVGKPYLEIDLDRSALARYGLHIQDAQRVIEVAIGGRQITSTIEGRERYPVRVRYLRERRDSIESLGEILVPTPQGAQIPLGQLAEIRYVRGPQAIKSEDTFLVGYVVFDKQPGTAEVDVVEAAQRFLEARIASGKLKIPAGVSFAFSGSYENQIRSQKTLAVVLPLALFLIFIILYLQFSAVWITMLVFSGIAVAWSGGFLMIWLYGQEAFLDFTVFGEHARSLFQVHPVNLSVAVWVGFLALFGIATDDGVLMATYLKQSFKDARLESRDQVRLLVIQGAQRRIRPALMTTATTLMALLPVLASTGRGSDIMVPMAIPSFGGMFIAILTMLVVPVLFCWVQELKLGKQTSNR